MTAPRSIEAKRIHPLVPLAFCVRLATAPITGASVEMLAARRMG